MSGFRMVQRLMPWLGLVLALAAFAADLFLPRGAAVGACYVLAVLTTFGSSDRRSTFGMALLVSVMTLAAWAAALGTFAWVGILNVVLTLATIWATAGILWAASRVEGRRERVQVEAQARKAWLAQTLASIGDGVIATDSTGRIEFMNTVAES